jgi:MFS family permease
MVAGMAAMTVSVLALAAFVRPDSSYLVLVGPLLVAGIGTSLAFPATASATMQSVTPDLMGPAGGVGTVAFQLGAAFGVSLVSAVFSSAGGYASAATFVDGLRPALLAVAVVTAIGVAAVNRFRGTMAGSGRAAGTEVRVSECEPAS